MASEDLGGDPDGALQAGRDQTEADGAGGAAGAAGGASGGATGMGDSASGAGSEEEEEDSSDSDSSAASSEPPEIGLDQFGRLVGVQGANYAFQAYDQCIAGLDSDAELRETILRDCRRVFTARQAEDEQAYSAGETYFIGAAEQPRTMLEQLALDIFKFHARGVTGIDQERGGAEWWTLVLDEDSDVAMHWDKDYGLEEDYCVNVFPNQSTVTYLSAAGGPTMVLGKTAPPRPTDDLAGPADKIAFCSRPLPGKHIAFDGRLLHFASADLLPAFGEPEGAALPEGTRVTFLVNIWFNHRPREAVALPQAVCRELLPPRGLWSSDRRPQSPQVHPCLVRDGAVCLEYPLGGDAEACEYMVSLCVPRVSLSPSEVTDSILLRYSEETAAQVSRRVKGERAASAASAPPRAPAPAPSQT